MKWLIISMILLGACGTPTVPTKSSKIEYKPVDKVLMKDVKPYSTKAEPTLKEMNEQKAYDECIENQRKKYNAVENSPNLFQKILDAYSCT